MNNKHSINKMKQNCDITIVLHAKIAKNDKHLYFEPIYTFNSRLWFSLIFCAWEMNLFFSLVSQAIRNVFIGEYTSIRLKNELFKWLLCQCNSNEYLESLDFCLIVYRHISIMFNYCIYVKNKTIISLTMISKLQ